MSPQSERFKRRLQAIPKAAIAAVQPALHRSAEEIVEAMKHLVPVESGDLRDSIVITPAGQSTPAHSQPGGATVVPENAVAITAGNSDVRYAHLVEYGTAPHPAGSGGGIPHPGSNPHPFFWPAFRLLRKRGAGRIKRAVGKAVRSSKA